MAANETLRYLFDDIPHDLSPALAHWMNRSPRFALFLDNYRDKIRKKIRALRQADSFQDLQAELETAYLLLREQRFTLAYEPYGRGAMRAPDFAVTFKTRITFNVEVTRMRRPVQAIDQSDQAQAGQPSLDPQYEANRLADIVCSKLGQMLPSMMNLLVILADSPTICDLDVAKAMLRLKQRAEQKEPYLYKRHGFRGPPDFFKHYQRLSGILVRRAGQEEPDQCPILWLSNQAKHPLPSPLPTILQR